MREVKFGNGITARERMLLETAEERRDHYMPLSMPYLIKSNCQQILFHRGLPLDPLEYHKREELPIQSPEWYAVEVLDKLRLMSVELEKGNTSAALHYAACAGYNYSEAVMKHKWEKVALSGQKSQDGTEAAKKKADQEKIIRINGWLDIADAVYAEHPTWRITGIRDEVAVRADLANRRQLENASIFPRLWPINK